mgnify:CR=1 FL=1|jgi:23S rRNA U2552 (ribose-2'-O)-methylase RlmE/FtsJ
MNTYTNKLEPLLIFSLNKYNDLPDGKNRQKINKINNELNTVLNNEKNKINSYYDNNCSWDKLKKFSNEYEFIYTSSYINDYKNIANIFPVSRSFFKLWEILNNFNFIIPSNLKKLKTAHIAEGPGGFIECIYKYLQEHNIKSSTEIYGITLLSNDRSVPNWKIKKQFITKYNINLNNDDGDLYNFENIRRFMDTVKNNDDNYNCCDFITSDGGFDFSDNYNEQENDFIIFLICEIYLILNLLKENGNSIIKMYDIYSKNSIKILYILSLFFEELLIIKPLSSRPANSEKYLLCNKFKFDIVLIKKYNELFKNIILSKNLNLLQNENAPYKFLKHISNYNKFYTNRQINYINKTINLIKKVNYCDNSNEKQYLKDIYNTNKQYAVEWCNHYNISVKQ